MQQSAAAVNIAAGSAGVLAQLLAFFRSFRNS
jgi:hypothetical protein